MEEFLTIAGAATSEFTEKKSRFVSDIFPVQTEEDVKACMELVRKKYHDARHHCYAYRIGLDGSRWRANDDGEPSGSAGRPILGQIDSAGLSDILVVVVRYFGGIKLGIPGLIRAYKTSTADALAAANFCEKVAGEWMKLDFPYSELPAVMKLAKDMGLSQRGQSFLNECTMEVFVRLAQREDFLERLRKINTFTHHLK